MNLIQKCFAELMGTFALVFCGTGAIVINEQTNGEVSHAGIAITFGLIVMVMIYSLGNVSGAHLNPAVTIAFTIAKRFKLKQVLPYIISQLIGAICASLILKFLFPANKNLGATIPAGSVLQSFILEFILTFFLMLVIINVATGSKEQGMFAGIAIGSTVLLEAMFAGPICGASMNPVRSVAPAVVSGNIQYIWLYVFAPVAGAVSAIPAWKCLNQKSNNIMKRILVLCTGNSCRSQIAEGYLKYFANDKAEVYSAGIEVHGVNPKAVETMKEDLIDISNQTSNNIEEYRNIDFDFVITVCDNAKERCPFFPTKAKKFHQNFPDPAKATGTEEEIKNQFRDVRQQIKDYCKKFIDNILYNEKG